MKNRGARGRNRQIQGREVEIWRKKERKKGDKIRAANVITAQHRDGEHCVSQWLLSPAIKCIRDDASGGTRGSVTLCVCARTNKHSAL